MGLNICSVNFRLERLRRANAGRSFLCSLFRQLI